MTCRSITAEIGRDQAERLRALAIRQGRSQSWYVARGLTLHVFPAYGAPDGGASERPGDRMRITLSLAESVRERLDMFCADSGRTIAWAVRVALEEYVFPTYDAAEVGVARG